MMNASELPTPVQGLLGCLCAEPLSIPEGDPLLASIAALATLRSLSPGERLCREGDAARQFWWVASGTLDVLVDGDDGQTISVAKLSAGSLVGEAALLRGPEARRTASIAAAEATTLVEVAVEAELHHAFVRSELRARLQRLDALRDGERSEAIVGREAERILRAAGADEHHLERGEQLAPSEASTVRMLLRGSLVGSVIEGGAVVASDTYAAGSLPGLRAALSGQPSSEVLHALAPSTLLSLAADRFRRAVESDADAVRLLGALTRLAAGDLVPSSASPAFGWKTILFLPQFAFEKAWQMTADAFIVDFQDAVPLAAKASVRAGLRRALATGELGDRPIVVRINENDVADEQVLDLDAVVGLPGVTALMPTMIERPEELDDLHAELSRRESQLGIPVGSTRLLPLIETPAAVLRVDAICQAGGGRLIGIFLGHGDLFRLTGARPHGGTTMDYPRNAVVFAARAAGIAAIDTPYTKVADLIGLEREAREAKRHGFDGKACVHRDQLATVARCLRPTPDEVAWAQRVEKARRDGLLGTLIRKLDDPETARRSNRQTDGMALVDGQLVGPPHIKASQRILSLSRSGRLPAPGRRGRVVSHASDAAIEPGAELGNPYEFTITEGMRDLWVQSFYSHDAAVTSRRFAAAIGRCDGTAMAVPYLMALYLCVSMSDTHGAIYHLGFRNARQHLPIQVGDTVRQRIRMLRVRNTADGRRSVVTTLRELVRMDDEALLFSTEKLELYPAQPADFGEPSELLTSDAVTRAANPLFAALRAGLPGALAERVHALGLARPRARFEAGDLLLHSFARPMGASSNLALSTQFLVTHPIHLDHHRYDQGDGLGVVVSGGLVISLVCAAASRDISHVVAEELLLANNVRTVSPGETVGAISFILERTDLPDLPDAELLVVKTIGVKNLTPSSELGDLHLPDAFLVPEVGGGSRYDELCRTFGIAALEGRVVAEVVRRIIRIRP